MTSNTRQQKASPINRRLLGLALLGLAAGLAGPVQAQDKYPSRTIKVIVPFPAGTAPDVMARFWAERLSKAVGQSVIVDNRPGASTIVGTQQFVAAPADGYTFLIRPFSSYIVVVGGTEQCALSFASKAEARPACGQLLPSPRSASDGSGG